jgi:hypothetical protein
MGDSYDGPNENENSDESSSSDLTSATSTNVFNDPFDPLNLGPFTVTESTGAPTSSIPTFLPSEETALVYSIVDVVDTQMGLGTFNGYACMQRARLTSFRTNNAYDY